MTQTETEHFHYDARTAKGALAIIAVLLALTLLAMFSQQNSSPRDLVLGFLSIAFLVVLLGLFLHAAKRHPVTLRVGPDGIDLPSAFKSPLPWHDINRIVHYPEVGVLQKREWLRIYLLPGVMPDYRLKSLRRLELWHLRRAGVSVPLHGIEGPSEKILASISRFHRVSVS